MAAGSELGLDSWVYTQKFRAACQQIKLGTFSKQSIATGWWEDGTCCQTQGIPAEISRLQSGGLAPSWWELLSLNTRSAARHVV